MSSQIVENLFLSGHKSDITFYVGKDKSTATRFPAHKIFLSLAGSEFCVMVDENFKENANGEVLITDVTPMAFKAVLSFIYTGKFNENINAFEINDILYASTKYMLESLTYRCLQHLEERTVDVDNFWAFCSIISTYYSELMPASFISKTLTCLSTNSKKILEKTESETINHDSLNAIVESNFLNIDSELSVFDFVLRWSVMECCRQKLDVTPENQRKVLGNVLYKVRYLLMSTDELQNGPLNSKILTDQEKKTIRNGCQDKLSTDLLFQNREMLKTKRNSSFALTHSFPGTEIISQQSRNSSPGFSFGSTTGSPFSPQINVFAAPCQQCNHQPCRCRFETTVIFVSSKDIVLSQLEMTTVINTYVEGNISGTDGKLIKPFTKHCLSEVAVSVSIEVCLKAYKCYKLSLKCEKGAFAVKSNKTLRSMFNDCKCFLGVPNEICNDLQSELFWQNFFNGKITDYPDTSEHPIKQFTFIEKWKI